MFVSSRRMFPLVDNGEHLALNPSSAGQWTTVGMSAAAMLKPTQSRPLNAGLYRKFRLRCNYTQDTKSFETPAIQFRVTGHYYPAPGIAPSQISLAPAAKPFDLYTNSATDWFTLGQGSINDLSPSEGFTGKVEARLPLVPHGSANSASLNEVVLECWDFTSPDANDPVAIIHESSLTWTRPVLSRSEGVSFPVNFPGPGARAELSSQYDITRLTDPNRFPVPTGFIREFRMRAIISTESSENSIKIELTKSGDTGPPYTWNFPGFYGGRTIQKTVMAAEKWKPSTFTGLENCILSVTWVGPVASDHTGILHSLAFEAHDIRDTAIEYPRAIKSMSRPLKLNGPALLPISARTGPMQLGQYRQLMTHGAAILNGDSIRTFTVHGSWFYEHGAHDNPLPTALKIAATDIVDATCTLEFRLPFQTTFAPTNEGKFQAFAISQPHKFGDGRAASIPNSSWKLTAELVPTNAGGTCFLADVALESRDTPMSDVHLPASQVFALQVMGEALQLPLSPGLNLGNSPFTITMWAQNSSLDYDAREAGDKTQDYILCKHGETWDMRFSSDGIFQATVTNSSGTTATVKAEDASTLLDDQWHHLALIWDGDFIKLAVDGTIKSASISTGVKLRTQNVATTIGSKGFMGYVRSLTVWDEALSEADLRRWMVSAIGTPRTLIAHLEFAAKLLINAPRAPEITDFAYATDTKISIESQGLVVTNDGCACMGADPMLHMTDTSEFTLEAWIAVGQLAAVDSVIAGKLNTLASGYGLLMNSSGKLVGLYGVDKATSATSLVVGSWHHVAMSFKIKPGRTDTEKHGTISVFIDGALDSSSDITYAPGVPIDNSATSFTAGARCESLGDAPICFNSFTGQIDEIRLWNVALGERELRESMYSIPDPDSPALITMWTFEHGDRGRLKLLSMHGNAQVGYYQRIVSFNQLPTLKTVPRYELGGHFSGSQNMPKSLLPAIVPALPEDTIDQSVAYLDFAFDMFAIILDICLDIGYADAYACRHLITAIWAIERVRMNLILLGNISPTVLKAMPDVVHVDPKTRKPPAHPRQAEEILDDLDVLDLVAETFMDFKRLGMLSSALSRIPKLSYWTTFRFLTNFTPPIGQIWLAIKLGLSASRVTQAVLRLQERLNEDRTNLEPPAIHIKMANESVVGRDVPLCIGGAEQTLQVLMDPVSHKGSVTVTITPYDNSVLSASPPTLTFEQGESGPKDFTVSALTARKDFTRPYVAVKSSVVADGKPQKVFISERDQGVNITPDETTVEESSANDSVRVEVSMAAILDSSASGSVDVLLTDDTSADDDPDTTKKLEFKDDNGNVITKLTFSRQSAWSHDSKKLGVNIKMVPKTSLQTTEIGKAPVSSDDDRGADKYKKMKGWINPTHITRITMVAAGKGESFLIADKFGPNTEKLMLVDGGNTGTWLRSLSSIVASRTLNVVSCTHIDQDHIAGLIEMIGAVTGAPRIEKVLFNDSAGVIVRTIPPDRVAATDRDLTTAKESLKHYSRSDLVNIKEILQTLATNRREQLDLTTALAELQEVIDARGSHVNPPGISVESQGFDSKAQSNAFVVALKLRYPATPLRAPQAPGGAVPNPSRNDLAIFPGLKVAFYGPSAARVTTMRAERPGEASNRASTIMVLRSKKDSFSALFPGDAWDRNVNGVLKTDIRGTPPLLNQHFTLIKVPHHGSEHSEDETFYHQYTADYYLISTLYSTYRNPRLSILRAILAGCVSKGINPIIITACPLNSGTFETDVVNYLTADLSAAGAKMYFFRDTTTSVTLNFEKGVLKGGWLTGLDVRP
ncbi:hypothetical protein CDV55_105425 [Aspergillus turcosus]|uniref:LamG-like jellyroll fold domain-containing protein n=1 Tax=Aspergillus turcosus TaxID=1245748 RepID=A0A229XID9_9EURO|nr:hypothetical protein CDV55_105425 [Aspergillus turcosus]RLL98685.1 hypothetical protein CFD26_105763 [Aspergillus turcosus]